MSFSQFATTPGNDLPKDESYKKVVDKRNVPDIGKGLLFFRIVSIQESDFKHGVEFWMNIGTRQDGTQITLPRVSPNPFQDFVKINRRTQGVYISRSAADKGCPLSKLADNRHPLIALSKFADQEEAKPNVAPFHAMRIQLIEPVKDAQGKVIMENGVPKIKVLPDERILKLSQNWWDQFVKIVEPGSNKETDGSEAFTQIKEPKVLPTKDLTKIVWWIKKEKKTENLSGIPKLDVRYVLDFSDKTTIKDKEIPALPEPPVDLDAMFKAVTDEELTEWMSRYEGKSGPAHDSPGSYGEDVPDSPSVQGQPGNRTADTSSDEAGF